MSGEHSELRLARAYLLRVAEPPAKAVLGFIADNGVLAAARLVREGAVPAEVGEETAARRGLDRAAADLELAARLGARLVTPEDDEWADWPLAALDIAAARGVRLAGQPLALWVRGSVPLVELAEHAVAVVGSRAATGYGEHLAAEFGYGLAGAGFTVVSGAAYGVDGAEHRGCLAAGAPTVAVLACGLDVCYPAGHADLLDRAAGVGAVISEYPPGTPPARHRFLVRNRLIAALSAGTVIIEAARRSGARNTAATARALGRSVMAVPGPVSSAMSAGCHEMLRNQEATLVTGVDEVLEEVGKLGIDLAQRPEVRCSETDGLDGQSMRVFEAITKGDGRSAERVSLESGVELGTVRALLPALELAGLARRCESGWRRADA